MLAEGQSCIYEDGRVKRKEGKPSQWYLWGSEGLANRVNQRWNGQMQRVMIRLRHGEVTMDLK